MTNESLFGELNLTNTEKETNVTNEYQGAFRKSVLDLDLLKYSLQCDSNFSTGTTKNLVITCVDQTGDLIPVTIKNVLYHIPSERLASQLGIDFENVYISRGDSLDAMSCIPNYSKKEQSKYAPLS